MSVRIRPGALTIRNVIRMYEREIAAMGISSEINYIGPFFFGIDMTLFPETWSHTIPYHRILRITKGDDVLFERQTP